jgi:hypothetical protein
LNYLIHIKDIIKWKKDIETQINPAQQPTDATTTTTTTTTTEEGPVTKKIKMTPITNLQHKSYNVIDVGLQVEVLQEELIAAKEEIRILREHHKREIDYLYLFSYFSLSIFIYLCTNASRTLALILASLFLFCGVCYCVIWRASKCQFSFSFFMLTLFFSYY